jgi:hypothetical protein
MPILIGDPYKADPRTIGDIPFIERLVIRMDDGAGNLYGLAIGRADLKGKGFIQA